MVTGGKDYKITALVALSDYSTLFAENSDLMFDSLKFSVAVMTRADLKAFPIQLRITVIRGNTTPRRKPTDRRMPCRRNF